jgi:fructose-bisphosphate aldolase class II
MIVPIASLESLLRHAAENRYAVGAFLSMNVEVMQATIAAAEAQQSPVVIRLHPNIRRTSSLRVMGRIARELAAEARVPVGISLDHGETLGETVDAIRAGCTSVMLDAAEEPLDENIRRVRAVVEAARPLGILVEAAIGHMEHGAVQTADDLAPVAEAVRLVKESGAGILAPAVGNVHGSAHGEVKATPNLAIERIGELREATGVPICLHGGSSIPPAQMKAATAAGVALVIIYTDVVGAFDEGLREVLLRRPGAIDILDALEPAQRAAQAVIETKMTELGSAGMLASYQDRDRCRR